MPGPPPKDPSVRARRNKASTKASLAVHENVAPPTPANTEWHPAVFQWWEDVWRSPMSAEWDQSDIHNVLICAMLLNDMWRAETPTARKEAAGEFRLQRKDLGLTPLDRRRLEWTIESADEAKDRGRARRSRVSSALPDAKDDPRQALRAVN